MNNIDKELFFPKENIKVFENSAIKMDCSCQDVRLYWPRQIADIDYRIKSIDNVVKTLKLREANFETPIYERMNKFEFSIESKMLDLKTELSSVLRKLDRLNNKFSKIEHLFKE